MEEIKCPSCGSGAVRKITEEKYECMACDNLFLVHNYQKSFRKQMNILKIFIRI